MLKGKKILIGVTGSIAAYKSAFLIRLLIKEGCDVKVVMTKNATGFISALTLSTLAKTSVLTDFANENETWNNHVELGLWADAFVVAPASANTMAKFSNGLCDNLLTAVYLSARCPVFISPAMDVDMWKHPSTQKNISTLKSFGNKIISVGNGELASGLIGEGRMAEPEEIISDLKNYFSKKKRLTGKKFLVNAGPTYEMIDPVRFIGNFSSGKMGFAIAEQLADEGAEVVLVAGTVNISLNNEKIKRINVTSSDEMFSACKNEFKKADGAVLSAAVADFKPINVSSSKIKKQENKLSLELMKTKDVLKSLGEMKTEKQLLVGFALETNDEVANAKRKLTEKNLDAIILNSLNDEGAGFGHDTNKISIISNKSKLISFEKKPKTEVAKDIVNFIAEKLMS